jgi:hypothetical protein
MEDLANIRVRHSMLLGVYVQMKNYLDCIERNYLGAMSSAEQELIDEMKKNVIAIEKTLWDYFHKEEKLMGEICTD